MEEHAIVDSSFSAIINAPLAPAGDFRSDSSLFLDCVRNPEA
jgi:hypothetical protein